MRELPPSPLPVLLHSLLLATAQPASPEPALEWLRRAEAGDLEALRQLYEHYHAPLYRYLRVRLGREDAEEVLQDLFVTLWHGGGRFGGRSSVATWLYGIANNLANNRSRYSQRRQHQVFDEQLHEGVATINPAVSHEAAAEFEAVLAAVRCLPAHERAVVELVYLGDLGLQESAQLLKIPLGTVKSRLSKARERLRQGLEGMYV
jgi:RNA polymerase sigma-70 factor, ECF subfamily